MSSSKFFGVDEMGVLRRPQRNVFDGMAEDPAPTFLGVPGRAAEAESSASISNATGISAAGECGVAMETPVPTFLFSCATPASAGMQQLNGLPKAAPWGNGGTKPVLLT